MEFAIALIGGIYLLCRFASHCSVESDFDREQRRWKDHAKEIEEKYAISSEDWTRLNNYKRLHPKDFYEPIMEDCNYVLGEGWRNRRDVMRFADVNHYFQMLFLARYGKVYMWDLTQGFYASSDNERFEGAKLAERLEKVLKEKGVDIEFAIDYIALKGDPATKQKLANCHIKEKSLCTGTPYRRW